MIIGGGVCLSIIPADAAHHLCLFVRPGFPIQILKKLGRRVLFFLASFRYPSPSFDKNFPRLSTQSYPNQTTQSKYKKISLPLKNNEVVVILFVFAVARA